MKTGLLVLLLTLSLLLLPAQLTDVPDPIGETPTVCGKSVQCAKPLEAEPVPVRIIIDDGPPW